MASSVPALVGDLLKSFEAQISRQNEALLTMQEERMRAQRQFEEEISELRAHCIELDEKAQRAEATEADHVRTIEKMAERHRQTRDEIASLRQRLQMVSIQEVGKVFSSSS